MSRRVIMLSFVLASLLACQTTTASGTRTDSDRPKDAAEGDAPRSEDPAAARAQDALQTVRATATAVQGASGAERAKLEDDLINALDAGVAFSDIERLRKEAQPGSLMDELLTFKLARVKMHLRDYEGGARAVDDYLKRFPGGRFAAAAKAMNETLSVRVAVDAKAIGVILPLSGDYKAYGERALTAIKLGLGIQIEEAPKAEPEAPPTIDPATGQPVALPADAPPAEVAPKAKKKDGPKDMVLQGQNGLKLVVKDTGGDPDRARQAVKDLVEKDHVIAIIGDVLLDTALPAALAAEEYGVPILSLSRKEGVAEAGPWTFRLALTAKKQAQALARFAMEELGLKRFGVMYPRHPYGMELMNAFWDEVDKRQGEVTAVESYAFDQTTFTTEAKALVGRSYPQSRAEYGQCVAEANAVDNDYQRKKKREKCTDEVTPIVDFEALLIPDGYRTVSYIVPALVAEDVLLTRDRRTIEAYRKTTGNNHVRPVQLLGPSMWNDPELGKRLGKQIEGAVFVDGFDARDQTKRIQAFVDAFARVHHSRPALIEAQAFDASAICAALLTGQAGAAPTTRDALRQQLTSVKEFPGVTGLVRFDEQGDSQTPLRFFQVEDGEIDAADEAALAKGLKG